MKRALLAILLSLGLAAPASAWHHILTPGLPVPVFVPVPMSAAGGSGSSAAATGFCIGFAVLAVVIAAHEVKGPACASNTKYNRKHGYNYPQLWRPLCSWKKRKDPVPVVKPLWSMGK